MRHLRNGHASPNKAFFLRTLPLLISIVLGCAATAAPQVASAAGSPPPLTRIGAPPQPPGAILLGDAVAAGAAAEIWDRMADGQPIVRNVTRPTITPFFPARGAETGAAVMVMPGGGFNLLAIDTEGWTIARWLAKHGVAAFVVKYRTRQTPADEQAMVANVLRDAAALMSDPEKRLAPLAPLPVADALEAVRIVRARAARWKIDPARVGMIGFSAGAVATRLAALSPQVGSRPAFFGYIYGTMATTIVPPDAPPMFAALALDDPLMAKQGFGIIESWTKAGRPVELHAYEKGGHGFGAGRPGTTTTEMLPQFLAWLKARDILNRRP